MKYDNAAWNLNQRTNNPLVQSFGVNSLNQLSSLSRSGSYTVAGTVSTTPTSVTVKDNANAPQAATVYDDNSFQRPGITLLNGNNTFQAVAQDSLNRWDTNTVTAYLPASATCYYDVRGNLTNDGRRVFYYDSENQLINVQVAGAWKSEFGYDGLMRRKVRKEFTWSSGTWVQTNEVRYVYDGRLVIQERHYTPGGGTLIPLNTITYTRGNDLSGTFEGAGGIAGLLARSEILSSIAPGDGGSTATYHADGNGNITALVATNGLVLARYSYDPYGNLLAMSGPMAEANLYRFSSKEWHEKSGLMYYLYRHYEPSLQRWINRDPIHERGGVNLYAFIANMPSGLIDPFGLEITYSYGDDSLCRPSGSVPYLDGENLAENLISATYNTLPLVNNAFERAVAPLGTLADAASEAVGNFFNAPEVAEGLRNLWAVGSLLNRRCPPQTKLLGPGTIFTPKILGDLSRRGWTQRRVQSTIQSPVHTSPALNRANNNPATAFFDQNGAYVVRDNVSGEIIQVSNRLDPGWVPDPSIANPFVP